MKVNCPKSRPTPPLTQLKAAKRVAALFPGALGDLVCFLPTLVTLRDRDRPSHLGLFCNDELLELLTLCHVIDAGHPMSGPQVAWFFTELGSEKDEAQIFFRQFDWIYSWTGWSDPIFRSNLNTLTRRRCSIFPFQPAQSDGHVIDHYVRCVGGPVGMIPALSVPTSLVKPLLQIGRAHV